MQNRTPFYPVFNPHATIDEFLISSPDLASENDVFSLHSPAMNPTVASAVPQRNLLGVSGSNKRKGTVDTDTSHSPASIHSENSNYSDTSYPSMSQRYPDPARGLPPSSRTGTRKTTSNFTTSAEEGSSDDNDGPEGEDSLARKREKHTLVEAQRRALEKAHFRELSTLITNGNDSKSTKLHHLDLLRIAAEQITEINARHKHDPLRPSNLTDNELNFLTIEASNSFLFVTTVEQYVFRVIHVTDSINRILNLTVDRWLGQDLVSFIHPEDVYNVRSQLVPLTQHLGSKIHMKCRIKQGQADLYSSVVIDGTTKMVDQSLRPLGSNSSNGSGFLAFIGICHLPLVTKYSETNMALHKNPNLLTFRCRCSPHDWKIFLVDSSVSTLPSVSYDTFRQKSILEFVSANEQGQVHQALLRSTTASTTETISCHFLNPATQKFIPMTLEIKSFFNPIQHRADFIELNFQSVNYVSERLLETSILDFMNDTKAIDQLLETDPTSAPMQPLYLPNMHPTTQGVPYYDSIHWPTKNELI